MMVVCDVSYPIHGSLRYTIRLYYLRDDITQYAQVQ